ncbi:Ras-related protein Rab-13 [Oopsacas minuta]|uniref:Ras-related protein Rab-13 n=1 Tax=Oopsacas minuta TaxID=111878 RepID=A0AAV7JVU8_9METZ|nr:Ras-related protein Rab-13 [Oopsacas minuta]
MTHDLHAKILITGDASVGKTSLINRFIDDKFNDDHVYTMGVDFSRAECRVSGQNVLIEMRDTAGQERFKAITSAMYRGTNGLVVVYDITDEESFENVAYWLKIAQESAVDDLPIIIIGNKLDKNEDRKVPRERGQVLAINEGTQFMEVSAKNNDGVHACFMQLIKKIIMMQNNCSGKSDRSPTIRLEATASRIYSQIYDSESVSLESSQGLRRSRLYTISESGIEEPVAVAMHSSPMADLCC